MFIKVGWSFRTVQDEWEEELGRLSDQLLDTCLALSARRRAAAPVLAQHVESCLAELAMGQSRVAVNVSWTKCSNVSMMSSHFRKQLVPSAAPRSCSVPAPRLILEPRAQ